MEKSVYTYEQVAEMNILSVLSKESERTNRGIEKEKLSAMFRFEGEIDFQALLKNIVNNGFVQESNKTIVITPEGASRLHSLRIKADKPALEAFARQEPIAYQTFGRVSFLEGTTSALALTFISAIFLILNQFVFTNVTEATYPFWLYLTILIIFAIIFLPAFAILIVSSFILLIKGMGLFLKPISFELWLYIEENAEKIAKGIIFTLIIIGIIVSYLVAGVGGLIRGFIVGVVFWMISHFKKIIEWGKAVVHWFKKRKSS